MIARIRMNKPKSKAELERLIEISYKQIAKGEDLNYHIKNYEALRRTYIENYKDNYITGR